MSVDMTSFFLPKAGNHQFFVEGSAITVDGGTASLLQVRDPPSLLSPAPFVWDMQLGAGHIDPQRNLRLRCRLVPKIILVHQPEGNGAVDNAVQTFPLRRLHALLLWNQAVEQTDQSFVHRLLIEAAILLDMSKQEAHKPWTLPHQIIRCDTRAETAEVGEIG